MATILAAVAGFLAGALAGLWVSWRIDRAEAQEQEMHIWGD